MQRTALCLLALLLCTASHAWPASSVTLDATRIATKLWRVIAISREYTPQFQAHVILEAPDGERLSLTFRDATARILIRHDVLELEPKMDIPADIPDEALGDSFIPHRAKWGKPRWLSERVKHEGHDLSKAWKLYLLQKSIREPAL
jgi:hypothetical protein